jgi:isopentenyl-diphosphate delta-isomerase
MGTLDDRMLELVDDDGRRIGTAEKLVVHRPPGMLHRALSVALFDERGRLLLQRRSAGKYHSPGVWSNSCCGHPDPGEPLEAAAARRVAEELGVSPAELSAAGVVRYALPEARTGLIEREFNHVFVGRVQNTPRPDPDEVAEVAFVTAEALADMLAREPFSIWFTAVWELASPAARARGLDRPRHRGADRVG